MRIGIDISQIVYGTGVGNFVLQLIDHLIEEDSINEYVLFGSSFRRREKYLLLKKKYQDNKNVVFHIYPFPPTVLDFLWNRLHILPIEYFIGMVDVFISSDWTQPPVKKARKVTIIYDMIVYKYPSETAKKIVAVQKRKWKWVKKEIDVALCISESTKKDAREVLGLPDEKLRVVYPGF